MSTCQYTTDQILPAVVEVLPDPLNRIANWLLAELHRGGEKVCVWPKFEVRVAEEGISPAQFEWVVALLGEAGVLMDYTVGDLRFLRLLIPHAVGRKVTPEQS